MRINRDIRFSKDKSPYKDHLDLWFWSGDRKGWDCSGFFFRLTPARLMLGAGIHGFAPPTLARYRSAVLDPKRGEALARAVAAVRKAGYEVGVIELDINAQGNGKGTMAAAARVKRGPDGGPIIEDYAEAPIQLTVKPK